MSRKFFHHQAGRIWRLTCLTGGFLSTLFHPQSSALAGALEDYVGAPDNSFSWKEEAPAQKAETAFRLEVTSQSWRGHVWQHEMLVVRPKEFRNRDLAFLFVTGDEDVMNHLATLTTVASQGGALAAVINHIPNQPLYDGRKEDALIAYTFDQFLKSGDKSWPLLFPMVKSAVRNGYSRSIRQETFWKQSRTVCC